MVNLVWGRPGAMSVEPVGNLPLYHFLPRADAFCIGTAGCPLDCSFCRTHELARTMPLDMQFMLMPPEKVVFAARENKCRVIAFTFNDPTACAEYMMDVSEAAARADIRTVAVTSGFITRFAIRDVYRHVQAAVVDLKSFDPAFYRDHCRGQLSDVLQAIVEMAELGIHIELVTTIIPGMNDSARSIRSEAAWIRDSLGMDTPLHLNAFTPAYRLSNVRKTTLESLESLAREALGESLRYVYIADQKSPRIHSYCHKCGNRVVGREGGYAKSVDLRSGAVCPACEAQLPFVLW